MNINERIKFLRKEKLKLSQEKFGEKLGVKRDVINNIENDRLKRPDQKEPLYMLICEKFNVSSEWLKDGKGDIFVEALPMDEFSEAIGSISLSEDDQIIRDIVIEYAKLDNTSKQVIRNLL